mmetsp:Transcript_11999/g.13651  ORF Transcript_11999/g.13651 Transcript_11999/m.13651 type:complete len:183 (-) Transcript_11999:38-586(-)
MRVEIFGDEPLVVMPDIEPALALGVMQVPSVRDKSGRQIIQLRLRLIDWKVTNPSLMLKCLWICYNSVLTDEENQRRGVLIIADMIGLTRDKFRLDFVRSMARTIQNALPLRIGGMRIVNQPGFFNIVWPIVSRLLKPKIRSRFAVIGKDYGLLTQWVDAECLPKELGGMYEHDHTVWVKAL